MKRPAAVVVILLVAAVVPVLFVAVRCHPLQERTHEDYYKDAIFTVQRATRRVIEAEQYDALTNVEEMLGSEAKRLQDLKAELASMPPPSRWECSRMQKHRALAESAIENWTIAETDLRTRLREGIVPPHLRLNLTTALDEFAAARSETWAVLAPLLD